MGRLVDGEMRKMGTNLPSHTEFDIIAHRLDSETPIIIMRHRETGAEYFLSDSDAQDTVTRIERALSILPTSK